MLHFTFIWLTTSCFVPVWFCPVSCHHVGSYSSHSFICSSIHALHPALVELQSLLWQDWPSWCRRKFPNQDGSRNSTTLHHGTNFILSTTFHKICFSNHWDSWHQNGIRTASDGLFPNGKLADLYKGFCLWHSQSWCLQMKVAKMKTTICICFCLCVLAGRDLIEITSCMRHDWGLFSDPSWPSPQMHILIGNCRCIDRFCISFSEDH